MSSTKSTRFFRLLLLLAVSCRLAAADCRGDTEKEVQDCVTDDGLKLLCVCRAIESDSNRTPICKQSIRSFLECHRRKAKLSALSNHGPYYIHSILTGLDKYLAKRTPKLIGDLCKCLNQSQSQLPSDDRDRLNSSSTRSSVASDRKQHHGRLAFNPTTTPASYSGRLPRLELKFTKFDFQESKEVVEARKRMDELVVRQKENLERLEKEWKVRKEELLSPRFNSSAVIARFSNLFRSEDMILVCFLASLLMVALVWCILFCCQKRSRSSTSSDLFISSTPINTYSPINSTMPSNISPISMHDDHARATLLDGSTYSVDVPSYDDIKPPSYDDAVKNSV